MFRQPQSQFREASSAALLLTMEPTAASALLQEIDACIESEEDAAAGGAAGGTRMDTGEAEVRVSERETCVVRKSRAVLGFASLAAAPTT